VRDGDAKERHHLIADIFFDDSPVFRHHPPGLFEDLIHDLFHLFRIELLAHGGESGKIGKKDGGLAALPFGCGELLRLCFGW